MKTIIVTACVAVGSLFPLNATAQVQQEWRGILSELEVSPHESLATNVVSIAIDSGWKAGLFCYSPGGIHELNKQSVYLQKRFSKSEQLRSYYETRRFDLYAENIILIGYGKKFSQSLTAGLTINYQSQKFSNDYVVKSSLLVQPSCLIQLSEKINTYAAVTVNTIKTQKRINNTTLAVRYDYSKHVVMNIDAGLSQENADCFIGISYLPTNDFKLQMRFDCLSSAMAFQVAYVKKRMGFMVGSKYHLPLGLSPFIGITTTL